MFKNLILLSFIALTFITPACNKSSSPAPTKDTVLIKDTVMLKDTNSGSLYYTVQVVSSNGLATHRSTSSQSGLSGALVSINQNNVIRTVTTDGSGLANFKLASGLIAVTISADNYTTLNYLASLGTGTYNSTMALVFPLTGAGTATITGYVDFKYDYTSSSPYSAVPDGTGINAYIDVSNVLNFVNVNGGQGTILKVAYQNAAFRTTTSGGYYTVTVPAITNGLSYNIQGDDFSHSVILDSTHHPVYTFSGKSATLNCSTGRNIINNITY